MLGLTALPWGTGLVGPAPPQGHGDLRWVVGKQTVT